MAERSLSSHSLLSLGKRMRHPWHFALVAAALLLPVGARAEPAESVAFEWLREPGAEACAERDVLAARVEARLARTVFAQGTTADTAISGRVVRSRTSPRWRATLSLTHHGEAREDREITSDAPSCRPLEDAVALFLGLLIESRAPEPEPEPTPAPEPASAPQVTPESSARPVTPSSPPIEPRTATAAAPIAVRSGAASRLRAGARVRRPWGAALSVGPLASLGVLPSLASGVRVAIRVASPSAFALELEGIALAEQDQQYWEVGHTTYSAQVAGLGVCRGLFERGRLHAGLCAGARMGVVPFASSGYTEQNERGSPLLAGGFARAWLSVQVWRWSRVGASAAGAIPFVRQRFLASHRVEVVDPVDGSREMQEVSEEIHRMSWVHGTAELHAAVHLP